MDRNREARRASIVGSVGPNRRRHRASIRDSPDEDGGQEFQESIRLRDRGLKKDRDRERERDRGRERDRERERERERERDLRERPSRSKRRRAERLTNNREDIIGDDETSEESVNDEEVDEEEDNTSASVVRSLTPAAGSIPNHNHHHSAVNNHHHNHHHNSNHGHNHNSSFIQQPNNSNSNSNLTATNHHIHQRKSLPTAASTAKPFRAAPWKSGDEVISVSVPRKARSASSKRSHDFLGTSNHNNSGVPGGEQILRQPSGSPGGQGLVPTSMPSPAAPMSPSSSNASARKKLKPSGNIGGPKLKPPKVSSSKPSSSNPEELEIEIAEVLYGLMTQSQGPTSKKEESRDVNRSNSEAKSRNSSPISNSTSATNPISGPNSSPLLAVAPKRKRPRQIPENSSYAGARSSPVAGKPDAADQTPKSEISSPGFEKISGAVADNVYDLGANLVNSQSLPAEPSEATESTRMDSEVKTLGEKGLREGRDLIAKEEVTSPKLKESTAVRADDGSNRDLPSTATASASQDAKFNKPNSMVSELENHKEEKFEIDLMAPPPAARPSPERENMADLRMAGGDQKPVLSIVDSDMKSKDKEEGKVKSMDDRLSNATAAATAAEEKKGKLASSKEAEWKESVENKRRHIDLQLDLEKPGVGVAGSKLQMQSQKQQLEQQQLKAIREEPHTEKIGHPTTSLPFPLSVASWPSGLPHMGYMAPLQGVVSMDGSTVTPAPMPPPLFTQPRPKRCATHFYIARNINTLQQCMKMNPFWQVPPTGSKACNLNIMPAGDLQGNIAVRGVNNAQDKGQSVSGTPNGNGKEKGSQPGGIPDSAQRKQQQLLIQQTLPPVAPANLLGPTTFIFPLNQQHATVAARPGAPKSPVVGSSSNNSGSAGASASAAAAAAMSFSYPNIGTNEPQYLAILQNNPAYPFPIPAAVGAPANYRGGPAQAMPLFNGSIYHPTQMIHASQLQQHQPPPSTQSQQLQNASASSNSSSSQKHLHSLQQRPQSSGVAGGSGNVSMQNFSGQKTEQSHQQQQQLQQSHNQYMHPSRPRQLEGGNSEDSPSTTDSRASRASMSSSIYGPNFLPLHPQNYALLTPPTAITTAAPTGGSSNHNEKGHQPQQQGSKNGGDSLPPQSFAMSFGPIHGAAASPGMDLSSMTQSHVMFKNASEATRQNYMMAAAVAAAHQKNFRISDDGNKSGGVDSLATDDERKSLSGKSSLGGGVQSIAFTRSDMPDGSAIQNNHVLESSRALNMASSGPHSSRPVITNAIGAVNVSNTSIQSQIQQQHQQQQQQQQMMQHVKQQQQQQQQQQIATAGSRNKVSVSSNGSIYPEHMNSSSAMATKFPLAGFPQSLVQSPNSSSQWKTSARTTTSQAQPSLGSSTGSLKNLPQQHSRNQPQMHTQISFGGNQKPSPMSQGQAPASSNQAPSSPMMVGSPTTSSISKGASGSPRTTSSSTTNKMGQVSSLSTQPPPKNSPSTPNQKSPSILGNPHISSTSSNAVKTTMQQQQQQLPKLMQQPTHLYFSTSFSPSHPHSASTSSTHSVPPVYYNMQPQQQPQQQQQQQRSRRPDQHQQAPGAPVTSSTGILSLGPPVTMVTTSTTNDPAKAMAAAQKGSGLPTQGMIQASQYAAAQLPAGFSYAHPVPAAVPVKASEQKQPTGHDNSHTWQSEKK